MQWQKIWSVKEPTQRQWQNFVWQWFRLCFCVDWTPGLQQKESWENHKAFTTKVFVTWWENTLRKREEIKRERWKHPNHGILEQKCQPFPIETHAKRRKWALWKQLLEFRKESVEKTRGATEPSKNVNEVLWWKQPHTTEKKMTEMKCFWCEWLNFHFWTFSDIEWCLKHSETMS